ncbi:Amino-acid acetyltransferase, mitochondrial, partial [Rhizophlyctis rosea]
MSFYRSCSIRSKLNHATQSLVLDVLSALPSQREARNFLQRFDRVPSGNLPDGVHLRDLVARPVGMTHVTSPRAADILAHSRRSEHFGLIKLEAGLPPEQLNRFARTLVQLQKLGLMPLIIMDVPIALEETDLAGSEEDTRALRNMRFNRDRQIVIRETFKVAEAIELAGAISKKFTSDSHLGSPVRTIFVNQSGGIAVNGRSLGFVNLEDEYESIKTDIQSHLAPTSADRKSTTTQLEDLDTARAVLSVLPSSSSAVIASAASSAALISNLITDKPITSTSTLLSPRTTTTATSNSLLTSIYPPTILRHGLKVDVHTSLDTISIPLATTLLENGFRKTLDKKSFWNRFSGVMDTTIVAGNYDGAAMVTLESAPNHNSHSHPSAEPLKIPYLDKFVVAPTSQ